MKVVIEYETYRAICIAAGRAQGSLETLARVLGERPRMAEAVAFINRDIKALDDALARASELEPLA